MANNAERYAWHLIDEMGLEFSVIHKPRMATDDIPSLRMAATLGVGVAMLPREFVDNDLRTGMLRQLLPNLSSRAGLVHAIFPTRRGMVPAVRHLLDALIAGYEGLSQK